MSYSVYAYLTNVKKVKSVYASGDKNLLGELYQSFKKEFDDLDNSFPDKLDERKNSYIILQDIVNGKTRFPEISFMYGYVYEKICEHYGQLIYNGENIWQLDEQSMFIPIPLSNDFPYIISIDSKSLQIKKDEYLLLEEGQGIGDSDYNEEREDLEYIFDEAIEKNMDLVICVY